MIYIYIGIRISTTIFYFACSYENNSYATHTKPAQYSWWSNMLVHFNTLTEARKMAFISVRFPACKKYCEDGHGFSTKLTGRQQCLSLPRSDLEAMILRDYFEQWAKYHKSFNGMPVNCLNSLQFSSTLQCIDCSTCIWCKYKWSLSSSIYFIAVDLFISTCHAKDIRKNPAAALNR